MKQAIRKLRDAALDGSVWHRMSLLKNFQKQDAEVGGRESMSTRYKQLSWSRKEYTGGRVYSLVNRLLATSVGQPWSHVRQKLASLLSLTDAKNRVSIAHFVDEHCSRDELGSLSVNTAFGVRQLGNSQYYVVPETGRLALYREERAPAKVAPITRVAISDRVQWQKKDGVWFECRLLPISGVDATALITDALLKEPLYRLFGYRLRTAYGREDMYCASKRQLSSKELRRHFS